MSSWRTIKVKDFYKIMQKTTKFILILTFQLKTAWYCDDFHIYYEYSVLLTMWKNSHIKSIYHFLTNIQCPATNKTTKPSTPIRTANMSKDKAFSPSVIEILSPCKIGSAKSMIMGKGHITGLATLLRVLLRKTRVKL